MNVNALLGQTLFQRAFGLEQHQRAVLLITDAQGIRLGFQHNAEGHSRSKQCDQTSTQNDRAHGALLLLFEIQIAPAEPLADQ